MRVLFLTLSFFLILSAGGRAEVSSATIKRVMSAVVPIVCVESKDGIIGSPAVVGSGFFVNRSGDVVTAGHVLDSLQKANTSTHPCNALGVIVSTTGWLDPSKLSLRFIGLDCQKSADQDIARCRTEINPFDNPDVKDAVTWVRFRVDLPDVGTDIAFTGFPNGSQYPISIKASDAGNAFYSRNNVSLAGLFIDKPSTGGESGSPVYLEDGSVVGIIVETSAERNDVTTVGFAFAQPSKLIVDFLLKLGIKVDIAGGRD